MFFNKYYFYINLNFSILNRINSMFVEKKSKLGMFEISSHDKILKYLRLIFSRSAWNHESCWTCTFSCLI